MVILGEEWDFLAFKEGECIVYELNEVAFCQLGELLGYLHLLCCFYHYVLDLLSITIDCIGLKAFALRVERGDVSIGTIMLETTNNNNY